MAKQKQADVVVKEDQFRKEAEKSQSLLDAVIEYTVDSGATVQFNVRRARMFSFVNKTRQGHQCSDEFVYEFLKVCQSRRLNPYDGDAFIVGYDSKDGAQFSIITSYQSLNKRAAASNQYDGSDFGLTVVNDKHELIDVPGSIVPPKTKLAGAWCKLYRKDRKHPTYTRIDFGGYNQGRGRWQTDPGGMIVKCAKAAAMREAFPQELGSYETDEEWSGRQHLDEVQTNRRNVPSLQAADVPANLLEPISAEEAEKIMGAVIEEVPDDLPDFDESFDRKSAEATIREAYNDNLFRLCQKYGVQSLADLTDDQVRATVEAIEVQA